MPETRYARNGDHSYIAYQVLGKGPPDIVFVRSAWNHIELQWEEPRFERFLRRLASFGRLIVFDPRGSGLSDPFDQRGLPTYEDWADDTLTVMDAVGTERAAIVCSSGGTPRAIHLTAAHPERVSSLVVCNGWVRVSRSTDYPYGDSADAVRERLEKVFAEWGIAESDDVRDLDPVLAQWAPRYRRYSVAPGVMRQIMHLVPTIDARHLLPAIRVPTLVLQHDEATPAPAHGRYVAEHIHGASYVQLPGRVMLEWRFPDPEAVAAEIEQFLLGRQTPLEPDRVLATVLFTDIVDSTRSTVQAGDKRWSDTLDALDRVVHDEVARFRGRVVKSTGDGHLATFDGPGRAIRCASTLRDRVGDLGLQIRAGLHTGEVEVRGEDIGGIAVNVARRVCDRASDGTVFVSSSVPPLVAGSEIEFVERGMHHLKGVPGAWQLYEVVATWRTSDVTR